MSKSFIRASKASNSTKRRIQEIVTGVGKYRPSRMKAKEAQSQKNYEAYENMFRRTTT